MSQERTIADCIEMVIALRTQIDRMREALARTQWVHDRALHTRYCPACESPEATGHAGDCIVAAALDSGRTEKT